MNSVNINNLDYLFSQELNNAILDKLGPKNPEDFRIVFQKSKRHQNLPRWGPRIPPNHRDSQITPSRHDLSSRNQRPMAQKMIFCTM